MPDVPVTLTKLDSAPVEQIGMARRPTLRAEIVQHARKTGAEELSPQPIHDDPRC